MVWFGGSKKGFLRDEDAAEEIIENIFLRSKDSFETNTYQIYTKKLLIYIITQELEIF